METFYATLKGMKRKLKQEQAKAESEYPDGNLRGSMVVAITSVEGNVGMRFPKPVGRWIVLSPDQAVSLAQTLIEGALQAGYDKTVAITIE
jgi:hypothetical protein